MRRHSRCRPDIVSIPVGMRRRTHSNASNSPVHSSAIAYSKPCRKQRKAYCIGAEDTSCVYLSSDALSEIMRPVIALLHSMRNAMHRQKADICSVCPESFCAFYLAIFVVLLYICGDRSSMTIRGTYLVLLKAHSEEGPLIQLIFNPLGCTPEWIRKGVVSVLCAEYALTPSSASGSEARITSCQCFYVRTWHGQVILALSIIHQEQYHRNGVRRT